MIQRERERQTGTGREMERIIMMTEWFSFKLGSLPVCQFAV